MKEIKNKIKTIKISKFYVDFFFYQIIMFAAVILAIKELIEL